MRRIWIFVLLLFITFTSSQTFGYYEDRVYCNFENNNVTIFLKDETWMTKCSVYIDTVYQLSLKKYEEIKIIRSYIAQWDDVYYRKEVLEQKKSELIQLINYRNQIKSAIAKFESKIFDNLYAVLEKPMRLYYSDLETQYYILINQTPQRDSLNNTLMIAQMEQQLRNVSHIIEAKTLDDIMNVAPSYLYLKNILQWKYE